ncbi:MAG: hypothetical protein ACR2ID_07340 [Chthoniobacterales bacterium]
MRLAARPIAATSVSGVVPFTTCSQLQKHLHSARGGGVIFDDKDAQFRARFLALRVSGSGGRAPYVKPIADAG